MINNLLKYCHEQGWSEIIYLSVLVLNYITQFLFLIFHAKKYGISKLRVLIAHLIIYPLFYYLMLVLAWIENGFTNWGANNIVRVFVYIPLITYLVAKIVKLPAGKLVDISAPCMALAQATGHLVCPFAGCCHGYACSWGIWNPLTDTYLFPNQWLECIVALLIVLYLLRLAKKENYVGTGRVYAMFLVTFGGTRFFLEFLRDNDKLFLGISGLALHALFMVLVGTIWLMVLYEKNNRKSLKRRK